ncbi:MAG: hypothetical protein KGZ72_01100 [Roseovarius sp.]|jgi:hypothetical protein|nr:hypothetical protein [Roseovarius sp.]
MFCAESFEERAAIMQFCGCMYRFTTEMLEVRAQGLSRWNALQFQKEVLDEPGAGNPQQGGDLRQAMAREQVEDSMPAMQSRPKEEVRPVPKHSQEAGWDRVDVLALQLGRGGSL